MGFLKYSLFMVAVNILAWIRGTQPQRQVAIYSSYLSSGQNGTCSNRMGLSSPWSPRNYRTLPPAPESQQYSNRGGTVYEDSNALHLILLESWPQLNLHARNNIKNSILCEPRTSIRPILQPSSHSSNYKFHPLGGALYHKGPLREAQYIKVRAAWS